MSSHGRLPSPEPWVRRGLFAASQGEWGGRLGAVLRRAAWLLFLVAYVAQNPGARRRRTAAVAAFGRAQLARRRGAVYRVDLGRRGVLSCPPSSSIAPVVAGTGFHEYDEELFVDRFVRPGDVVVDLGASIGFFAIPLARRGARVATFEPASVTRAALQANVDENGVASLVQVFAYGVADFDGPASFTRGLDAQNHLVVDGADGAELDVVEVRRLDTLLAGEAPWLGESTFVKVDVEGFDEQALDGASELLARARPVVMVETREGGAGVRARLASRGYGAYWYDATANDLVPFPEGWPGNFAFHTNMLFIPHDRVDEVRQRLARADRAPLPPPRLLLAATD